MKNNKRQLDDSEKEMANKGITSIEHQIDEIKEQKEFNERTITFQKVQDEYQEAIRPFIKKRKALEDKRIMDSLNEQLTRLETTLNSLKDQLKNGVISKE